MKIFGLEIRKAGEIYNAVDTRQGWFSLISEPWNGAWQSHVKADAPRDVLTFSAVFACITTPASDIAKMRPMLVKKLDTGICDEVKDSPFLGVLETPNRYQNHIAFFQQWVCLKLMHGNAYALKERDNRRVVRRLHLLDPCRVTPLVTDAGDVYYRLSADNLAGIQDSVTVPASEIIHDRMEALWHPLVGISPIYACGLSATMGNRIQQNSTKFFSNMSRPGGVLLSPSKLDPADITELKRQWEANYGGDNSGKTAVLANGLTFSPINAVVAEQAQLVEQLGWTVEDVARCFRMPIFKLGGPTPPNTSVEALEQIYYTSCLQILIEAIERCLKDGLELPASYYIKFDLRGLLRMDTAARYEAISKAVRGGWMAPNEGRAGEDMPPVVGGETPYMQHQDYPLSVLANPHRPPPDARPAATPEPKPSSPPDSAANDAYAASLRDIVEKASAALSKATETVQAHEAAKAIERAEIESAETLARLFMESLHEAA